MDKLNTPAAVGTVVTFAKKTWKITAVKSDEDLPHLHALRIEQGFDGYTYTVERIRTSKRQRALTNFLLRGTNNTWQSAW